MAKILVVDDEARMAHLVCSSLRDSGYSVTVSHDGESALQLLATDLFDMVITDLKMQPPDGLQILRVVKEQHPETGVILMTAFATAESAVAAMKAGAYDYLVKPFSLDELVILVDRYFETRRTLG